MSISGCTSPQDGYVKGVAVMTLPPLAKMAPDTRPNTTPRASQIAWIARMLKIGAADPHPDPERHYEGNMEGLWEAVYSCSHNDVVARAVYAAQRDGNWGASVVLGAALEREKLNKTRAANMAKYGARK